MAALTRMWRIGAGLLLVAGTVVAVGTGPFLQGVASVSGAAIVAAVALAAVATGAAAWRWRMVATRLGLALPWRSALAAYYRSQFVNSVLPGGILGDVHRAYAHGRDQGAVGAAARAVAAERVAGQIVQATVTLTVVLPLGFASALGPVAWSAGILGTLAGAAAVVAVAIPRTRRLLAAQLQLLRPLARRPAALVAIVIASVLVVAAHVAMFLVAASAVGVASRPAQLVPLALAVLCASALPLNVGGWGPREAASAAVFAVAGFASGAGVAVSTAYGVLGMLAVAPGALVLLGDRVRARTVVRRSEESA
ncbi:hypothetical protein LK09_18585 [Microbacterium mangrovi]|uniref:Dolichol-P-glucose synthetase-like protein n=1 Tax=Microbacterium mangrovi TaxID=1348253 RepID=A0A0B1ZY38_9MICO|nr:lysylphosphatidylglycerol synthase domain-containing protein [Microbacterium mangrovi]KHK95676.1 hypothetical protein LK09_18585 [Microbacterium mangrovi]